MKNPAVPPGESPEFCKCCGATLVRREVWSSEYREVTGNPIYTHRMVCPARRWWRPQHKAYTVMFTGTYLDEEYLS
jgi:hypothetical protein